MDERIRDALCALPSDVEVTQSGVVAECAREINAAVEEWLESFDGDISKFAKSLLVAALNNACKKYTDSLDVYGRLGVILAGFWGQEEHGESQY